MMSVLLSVAMSQQESASVEYLRGVPRHGNQSFTDYFFSCNTTGTSLDWVISGSATLSFFGNLSAGLVKQTPFTNAVSFATLLSISHIANDIFRYGSILVVSSTTRDLPLTLTVRCSVGAGAHDITANNVSAEAQNPIVTATSGDIFFQYLLSTSILNGTMTNVYSCGVDSTTQGYVVNDSQPLLLNSNDPVGRNRDRFSADNIISQKVILISMELYMISSLFFVTGPEVLDVRCASLETNRNINASAVIASLEYKNTSDSKCCDRNLLKYPLCTFPYIII